MRSVLPCRRSARNRSASQDPILKAALALLRRTADYLSEHVASTTWEKARVRELEEFVENPSAEITPLGKLLERIEVADQVLCDIDTQEGEANERHDKLMGELGAVMKKATKARRRGGAS